MCGAGCKSVEIEERKMRLKAVALKGVAGVRRRNEKHEYQGIEKSIEIEMTTNDLYCLPALSLSIKIDTRKVLPWQIY